MSQERPARKPYPSELTEAQGTLVASLMPTSPVSDDFARWRDDGPWATMLVAWCKQPRQHAGREPTPRAACLESQSVKTTELGGAERGDDGAIARKMNEHPHRMVP